MIKKGKWTVPGTLSFFPLPPTSCADLIFCLRIQGEVRRPFPHVNLSCRHIELRASGVSFEYLSGKSMSASPCHAPDAMLDVFLRSAPTMSTPLRRGEADSGHCLRCALGLPS